MQLQTPPLCYIFGIMINTIPPQKIWVFTHKSAFMQRVADYVRTGHQAYIKGVTVTESMFKTYEKLLAHNPIFDDKLKAFRAREQGYPTGRLLIYLNENDPSKLHWFLLLHAKTDQLPQGEKWLHAEDPHSRIQFTGYELARVTKEGAKKPVLTWRYNSERFQDLRDSIVMAIRSNRDQDLKQLIESLFGTMGFSGSREQAKSLVKILKDEWKRRRPNDQIPEIPKSIGWVRRKADKGIFIHRPKMQAPEKKTREVNFSHIMNNVNEDSIQGFIDSLKSQPSDDLKK
jgi:hypothetical protein